MVAINDSNKIGNVVDCTNKRIVVFIMVVVLMVGR